MPAQEDGSQAPPGSKRYAPCFMLAEQQAQESLRENFRSRKLVRCTDIPSVHAAAAATTECSYATNKQGADQKSISGLDRFDMVYKSVCSGLCFTPHLFQLEFFRQIIQSMAEGILGPHDWQRHGVALMQRMGWTHNRKLCLASAPRRVGKTVILALVQVSVARYVPSVQITFSTGKRASDGLRNYVIKIMQNSGLGEYLQRAGQEELEVVCIDGGDIVSILKFFPANPDVRVCDVLLRRMCVDNGWAARTRNMRCVIANVSLRSMCLLPLHASLACRTHRKINIKPTWLVWLVRSTNGFWIHPVRCSSRQRWGSAFLLVALLTTPRIIAVSGLGYDA